MEKKKYSKPVVVAERFEPQEYCVACWYVKREDVLYGGQYSNSGLFHDTDKSDLYTTQGLMKNFWEGRYNRGERVATQYPYSDLPGNSGCFHENLPQDINDGDYYLYRQYEGYISYGGNYTEDIYKYSRNISGPLYRRGNYYFTNYTKGNVS